MPRDAADEKPAYRGLLSRHRCLIPGLQGMLAAADPERFFVAPYVGHRGWLGMRLDLALDWNQLAGIIEDACAEVAPRSCSKLRATRPRNSR
jgi:hypothetical protein